MDSGLAARKEVSQSLKRTKSGESVLPANLQDKLPHNKTSKSVAPDKIVSEKKVIILFWERCILSDNKISASVLKYYNIKCAKAN